MKKAVFFLLSVLLISPAFGIAADSGLEPPATPLRKLQRGFLNMALSPMEIAYALSEEKRVDSFIPTWMTNAGKGTIFAAGRALTGVYEMVTFPLPFPADYEPVVYPEYAWEHFQECSAELGKC